MIFCINPGCISVPFVHRAFPSSPEVAVLFGHIGLGIGQNAWKIISFDGQYSWTGHEIYPCIPVLDGIAHFCTQRIAFMYY